jgi:hypothetical protein
MNAAARSSRVRPGLPKAAVGSRSEPLAAPRPRRALTSALLVACCVPACFPTPRAQPPGSGTGGGGAAGAAPDGAAGTAGGASGSDGGVRDGDPDRELDGGAPDAPGADASDGSDGAPRCRVATAALITDFSNAATDGGTPSFPGGGVFTYGGVSAGSPAASVTNGALHFTLNAPATTATQFEGLGFFFDPCVDASAYGGVRFTLGGTAGACSTGVSFAFTFAEDASRTTSAFGECGVATCYPPAEPIAVPSQPTQLTIHYGDVTGGAPSMTVDPMKLVGLQWTITVPAAGCVVDLTVDDVTFVP